MLSIVATPIGNLEDITLRALRTLKEADVIIAEDTRHSRILLDKYEIRTPLTSFHSHSSEREFENIMQRLRKGEHCALISDAGTPGISDPGVKLIQQAILENIPLTAIPGPSAVITAVVASGLPCHRFLYLGYLPLKKGRKKMLESLKNEPYTLVIYEAPHRMLRTLSELKSSFGNRRIGVCREMTKMYEEVIRGTIEEAEAHFKKHSPRGEFTLVIAGFDGRINL